MLKIVERVSGQVDKVVVALNGYPQVPEALTHYSNVEYYILDNSLGDGAKILTIDRVEGYYVSWDDDLLMPSGCVDFMKSKVDQYNALISFHGKLYVPPISHFKKWSASYRVLGNITEDKIINVIGSGCAMWHTDRLKISIKNILRPNMADIWLSKSAVEQNVPMYAIKHNSDYITYIPPPIRDTIWDKTKDYTYHTNILNSFIKK